MTKIAIIYQKPKDKITEFIFQSIMFYYRKDIHFDIFTLAKDELLASHDLKYIDNVDFPAIQCLDLSDFNHNKYSGVICITTEDMEYVKKNLNLNNPPTHYICHNTQALVIKNVSNSIKEIEFLLNKYKKCNKSIERIVFVTLGEVESEVESRIIQDLTDFELGIEVNTLAEIMEQPVDPATLLITAPYPALFPVLNMTSGKYLIKEILNNKLIITVANTVNYNIDPQKLISNLRKNYEYIFNNQYCTDNDSVTIVPPYSGFAEFYEIYMKHVDYKSWASFVIERFQEIKKRKPVNVLELACGTASISRILKTQYYDVEACDLVPEMLDIARFLNRDIKLFQADMTKYKSHKSFDLIISMFDSVNYLKTKKEIEILLQNTAHNLNSKGIFIFDISTFFNSKENFDGFINVEDNKENFLLHRAEYLPNTQSQETELNLFIQKFNVYTREDEIHEQKVWKCNELLAMIEESDFTLNGIYDISSDKNLKTLKSKDLDNFYSRLFFVLEKNV